MKQERSQEIMVIYIWFSCMFWTILFIRRKI